MSFYTSIYGLNILLNEQVPGIAVIDSPFGVADVEINFRSMPSWFRQDEVKRELWYVSPEQEAGEDPRLLVWELVDADHYQVRYADGTQFLIDKLGTRIWATWPPETLTLEDTATYLLGPMMGFVLLLRGCISLHSSESLLATKGSARWRRGFGQVHNCGSACRLGVQRFGRGRRYSAGPWKHLHGPTCLPMYQAVASVCKSFIWPGGGTSKTYSQLGQMLSGPHAGAIPL